MKHKNFPVTILRFYLVYGPYQDTNRFISQLICSSLKKEEFATTYGNQCRDFLYISDAISAILKALLCKKNIKGEIFNIGFGKCIKLKKVMGIVKKEVKFLKPNFGKISLRKDEFIKSYPSIKKAKKILGWYPKISLNNGIRKTKNYYIKSIKIDL